MTCYFPIHGYRSKVKSKNGKFYFTLSSSEGYTDMPVVVPCGKCIGCREQRAKSWSVRCVHEASLFSKNCFITLTYSPENIPKNGTIVKRDFQLFMKRLRRKYCGVDVVVNEKGFETYPIRFFACGEYGERFERPHYHACIFNFDFEDKRLWSVRDDVRLYRSDDLESIWSLGYCIVGDVTEKSAAYVARYIGKKVTGEKSVAHYMIDVDKETGEVISRLPEFILMSRRPGIGRRWFEKYSADVFPDDFIVLRGGKKVQVPRYYDNIYSDECSVGEFDEIKMSRKVKAFGRKEDNTPERLAVRHECKVIKYSKLKRGYEGN